jgi:hypothetical protein
MFIEVSLNVLLTRGNIKIDGGSVKGVLDLGFMKGL